MTTESRDMVRLETIVREFRDAVIACDQYGRILLYNAAASRLFHEYPALGLGRSLYTICARPPIENSLRILKHRSRTPSISIAEVDDARFVCATADGKMLLTCRLNRMRAGDDQEHIFVFTFADMTRQITEEGRQGYLLDKMIKDLRAPLTNLGTAVENLKSYPEMSPVMRRSFEDIIAWESRVLTQRFSAILHESEKITSQQWPLFDVYSEDLFNCVGHRLAEGDGLKVTMTGVPLWLHGDSHALMLILHRFLLLVRDTCSVTEVDIETLLGDRRVFIDIVWQGTPLPQSAIEAVLEVKLPDITGMSVADVLTRHDSEVWSQRHRREGYALLRIPVPDSPRQWMAPVEPLPTRTEFYDFSIAETRTLHGNSADRPLTDLTYVVFDTETTGLRPAEGDELLALTAVRIVNGRILNGERFESLIQPQRPIPESARPFLDVTEEMLREESPAQVVLPRFKSFLDDAVLVAHNAAFDLKFFQGMEESAGVRFDNPMLDTLLLASVVDSERTDHTLQGIGRSLGLKVQANQGSMDDCFATAQIFLHLLDRLASKGITTLGEALAASKQAATEKRQQLD